MVSVPRLTTRTGQDAALNGGPEVAYKVHHLDVDLEKDESVLETFLNELSGEVISIIPNIKRTTLAQIYGGSRKIDFLLIIERT